MTFTRLLVEILDNLETTFSICVFIWLIMCIFDFTWGLIKKWSKRIYKAIMGVFEKKAERKEEKLDLYVEDGIAYMTVKE